MKKTTETFGGVAAETGLRYI